MKICIARAAKPNPRFERTRFCVFASLVFVCADVLASAYYGKYNGRVVAEWLTKNHRDMKLMEDFSYTDPDGLVWKAPSGSVVDGASIPQVAWSIIGGPFEGPYRPASVIHDVACVQRQRGWESTHQAFYNAMLASKVGPLKAKIMYAAVYHFGPRWKASIFLGVFPLGDVDRRIAEASKALSEGNSVSSEAKELYADTGSSGRPGGVGAVPPPHGPVIGKSVYLYLTPKATRLSLSDFEVLKSDIRKNNLSLAQIRSYESKARK